MTFSKTLKLSNGVEMPIFGLGTWQSGREEVINAVRTAVLDGYRLIDTATCYQNEDAIGEALQQLFKEGVIKREEIFITTKCWTTHLSPEDQEEEIFITTKCWTTHLSPEDQEEGLRESLERLKLDYVDLWLAHMPGAFNKDMSEQRKNVTVEDVWKGFESLYEKKLTRAIGVSNFSIEQIERIMKIAKVPIHNHQVELHLYFQQKPMVDVCKKHNISVTAYSPIGSPGRVHFVLPNGYKPEWPPAPSPLEDSVVVKLAEKYSRTPAQILLRHLMQHDIAVIPKSTNDKRIKENHGVFDFEISDEDIKKLDSAPQNERMFWQDFLVGHPEDPFKSERK
uniref:NADP-dependent oxidoreductase domain-containing protein n=1 Tax=Panagrolaimus sp. PS1159 TaxID=55785 RepID=A0AC35FYV5_9BILA